MTSSPLPTRIPHGRTARRLEWTFLPPHLRKEIEHRIGSSVVEAQSRASGFTPGFASVLVCADGSRHFVKAASTKAQKMFADAYREEARKLGLLPPGVPAPQLQWLHDADDWVALGFEYVDGRAPLRPWLPDELAAASRMAVEVAALLTPAPAGIERAVDAFADWPSMWDDVDHPRAADCRALAARFAEVVDGDTVAHTDIRDDNLLVRPDGTVVMCDWNWPVVGAAWLDSLFLLIGPRGDGLDVEAHLAAHPLLSSVDPEDIDVVIALILGYFYESAALPVPPTSPYIREAQAWQRDVLDNWLAERRGWERRLSS
ncbi:phosphotransferase [Nocardioides humilatus]|uniref:Phosphotransferase n=1 Tax=Nocardioides humilatus TaxID=2607660 RepID=A0A5B1LDB5_9ACTN|nr:phosphotransferase [Nocardioides humilatus]KAA1417739.1 phosphotransferase [Nocardioides humilatus]